MRVPIPKPLKSWLRPTGQWLAISLPPSQHSVTISLVTAAGEFDVTDNSAVAAMRPFTLRIGLNPQLQSALQAGPGPELHFVDRELGRIIGVLRLRHLRDWNTAAAQLALFEVAGGAHRCAHWLRRGWDSWRYERAVRNIPPEKVLMAPTAVEQMMVFYLRPRPVFLVSVDDGRHSNIFPMDLVGPLQPAAFTLALRNTSPSVETIKRARRVAMADVPGTACRIAYQLGAHHKQSQVDWDSLPFKTFPSREFALRVPAIALRVREVEILDFQTVGSHTLFLGRIVSEQPLGQGAQLFHTSAIHQQLRMRYKRPFQEALTPETA
jgi:flavin reductase (DIM6/NTAB) family NADH-FMN oxidoreductase RutF